MPPSKANTLLMNSGAGASKSGFPIELEDMSGDYAEAVRTRALSALLGAKHSLDPNHNHLGLFRRVYSANSLRLQI